MISRQKEEKQTVAKTASDFNRAAEIEYGEIPALIRRGKNNK